MVAAQMCGAVPVPLYQDAVAEEMAWVLEHCGARFVVAGDQEQVDKVLEVSDRLPRLEHVVYLDPRGMRRYDHRRLHRYDAVQAAGRAAGERGAGGARGAGRGAGAGRHLRDALHLGHHRPAEGGGAVEPQHPRDRGGERGLRRAERDRQRARLPADGLGRRLHLLDGPGLLDRLLRRLPGERGDDAGDLREIGPSYFFAPPRFYEGLLTSVTIRMEDAGRLKRAMFGHFMAVARRVGPAILDRRPVAPLDRLRYALGDLLVYGPLRNVLGLSRIRVGYTAGEAIGPEIFAFYRALGINLKQLYGQTEASVFITQQPDGEVRPDTVGVPSPGVELRIAECGEVFYRSPGVFVEYYRSPESTAETKDAEGWVATGDAGYIEAETGHLRIIDRAKDVGRMADGSLFAPKYVENKLKFYPSILEAVAFGSGRAMATAFVNIDLVAVGNWAERNGIAYASYQELAAHPRVYAMIQGHVEEVNRSLAADPMLAGCQVRRFLILHKELDADDGELTRTRKVRRRIIEEKYADLIRALYDGSPRVATETEVSRPRPCPSRRRGRAARRRSRRAGAPTSSA